MTTFTWAYPLLEVSPQIAGKTDVVVTIHWRCTAVDAYQNTASQAGQLTIPFDPQAPFVPFAQLTPGAVQGWIAAQLDVPELQSALAAQLDQMAPPPALVPMQPPWGA